MSTHAAPLPATAPALAAPLRAVLATSGDRAAIIARLAAAVVLWPHGAQKLLGWFHGFGWSGSMGYFTGTVGLPAPLAALVILIEFFAPILLVIGLGTRIAALGVAAVMVGAATAGGLYRNGFFMNWFGNQPGEGIEFFVLIVALALVLVVRGGGAWSIDRGLAPR